MFGPIFGPKSGTQNWALPGSLNRIPIELEKWGPKMSTILGPLFGIIFWIRFAFFFALFFFAPAAAGARLPPSCSGPRWLDLGLKLFYAPGVHLILPVFLMLRLPWLNSFIGFAHFCYMSCVLLRLRVILPAWGSLQAIMWTLTCTCIKYRIP